ncbi:hypothetical protein [Candidatus Magnetobacterium casense]|uniref:Uncharacterized protein n=1 Tax=Candidatus Magnetobacterium casense TaxID=1455061 RepID=A0ABS6RWF3_9BACT|nr:hypothetical protein [Candidatus Magnetobacterium casensis]MBV6340969.1 hypothetical protein [Candidatus Magnetobacterium casensis]
MTRKITETMEDIYRLRNQPVIENWHPDYMDVAISEIARLRAELEASERASDILWESLAKSKSDHEGCGLAIVMLSRALRGAMDHVPADEGRREQWEAILGHWGREEK